MSDRLTVPSGTRGVDLLRGTSTEPAITTADHELSYSDLRRRVAARGADIASTRRLVGIEASNDIEPVVTYLAALAGGHPVLLLDGGDSPASAANRRDLVDRMDPDVVLRRRADGWRLEERRSGSRHDFHPDLAMLSSTSGSTGSPKLVRLSRRNLLANAASIADYLHLTPRDRAATTLPMHYCYGLSVLNSHLIAGASVRLTDASVIDEGFWSEFETAGATSFAGVPHTFELLDASGFAERVPRSLRYVTQAGGRMPPDAVRRHAALGRRHGYGFVVMYGQTEATARMAYLPPELAESRAGTIGVPIPGGSFRVDEEVSDEPGVGELVYAGPNVMMGYAEHPGEFALGREVDELRTGDLARRHADGFLEIVGRADRFVKLFGLRIDLDRIERLLGDDGVAARVLAVDERLVVFVIGDRVAAAARRLLAERLSLPAHAVHVLAIDRFPATPTGKPDYRALTEHARRQRPGTTRYPPTGAASRIRDLYADLLGRPDATVEDSFTSLDGDSLSYVEVSIRLGELLGTLPEGWPERTGRELAAHAAASGARAAIETSTAPATVAAAGAASRTVQPPRAAVSRRCSRAIATVRIETSVVLRAVAIVLIVASHSDLISVQGGAHLLLAVAGFNLARFRLSAAPRRRRVHGLLRAAGNVAIPAVIWIGAVAVIARAYEPATAVLVNGVVGSSAAWSAQWQFWFLEALVWGVVGIAAVVAVPALDRAERRRPFLFALAVVGATVVLRLVLLGGVQASGVERYAIANVAAFIAVGWLVARADTTRRRVVASFAAVAVTAGFFGDPLRESVVVVGCLLLAWVPALPVPRMLRAVLAVLAASSLYVYLTHWQVYPPIEVVSPVLAVAASFAVGIVAWQVASAVTRGFSRVRAARRSRAGKRRKAPVRSTSPAPR